MPQQKTCWPKLDAAGDSVTANAAAEADASARIRPAFEIDVVHLASGDVNIGRNTGAHIEQGVQLDGAFVSAKLRPRKKLQARIDGGGIEGVDRVGELDAQGLVGIEFAGGVRIKPCAKSPKMRQSRCSLA